MTFYIRTSVELKAGQNPGYYAMMDSLVPYMAQKGWKLLFGLAPCTGDLTELAHIWEVKRFEDINLGLDACANDPAAHAILAPIPGLIHKETIQIMIKTPYSP